MIRSRRLIGLLMLLIAWAGAPAWAEDAPAFTDEQLAFFETRIRPVLADNCYACHSHDAKRLKGGFYLDSRAGILEAALAEPGDPDASMLIQAVRWTDPHTQMPPAGKLDDAAIADLERWVEAGLPWPEEADPGAAEVFDLEARRAAHWAWQAPRRTPAPPPAGGLDEPGSAIDRYIGKRLAEHGLSPAPPADRATLIRRVTLDLTGLPPTPEEVDAFVKDQAPDAYEKLVDRLLASPRFGEAWARHWMDLVRYAESYGHEFDFNIHQPWRYRDYLIRALNDDLPYDRFVREHLAGDLLEPRVHAETGENQSPMATAFYWLGEQTHSPVDVKQHQADRIDNQIDVLTKSFQAMTVACARCHDHKFDAISTEDYYALYGVLQSTRMVPSELTPDPRPAEQRAALERLAGQVESTLRGAWDPSAERLADYLLAAEAVGRETREIKDDKRRAAAVLARTQALADQGRLDTARLRGWVALIEGGALRDGKHPLHAWHVSTRAKPEDAARWWRDRPGEARRLIADHAWPRESDTPLLDPRDPTTYRAIGSAFQQAGIDAHRLAVHTGRGATPGTIAVMPGLTSANRSAFEQGALHTATRTVNQRYIHVLAQGRGARLNVLIDGFEVIRNPIYGGLRQIIDSPVARWYTFDLEKWDDGSHDAYVELIESPAPDVSAGASPRDAYATVYAVVASDERTPWSPGRLTPALFDQPQPPTLEQAAQAIEQAFVQSALRWQRGELGDDAEAMTRVTLLNSLLGSGVLGLTPADAAAGSVKPALAAMRELDAKAPRLALALAAAEGTGRDSPIFVRGSHRSPGSPAPRGYLTALVGDDAASHVTRGSGRRELADAITDPGNPLTARVQVNRIWHHLFGVGIVPTVDNFGYLGQAPSHPELLDHLALAFIEEDNWSNKAMIQRIVMSKAYQRTSDRGDPRAESIDPTNALLHRQRIRRLPAEAIRDSILLVAGSLDERRYGPPVPTHLTEHMQGRGRPKSGPLDGAGRRSIYVSIRRNFLSPMMLTFDAPIPFSTVGRRNTTNVPAQALALMNDPFVHDQAGKWAARLVADERATPGERIDAVFFRALGRPPTGPEREAMAGFIADRAASLGLSEEQAMTDARPWRAFCHAIFNTKGFVFRR